GVISIFILTGTSITGGSKVTGGGTFVSIFNSTGISAILGTIGTTVFNLGGDSNNDSRRDIASSNEGSNLGKPSNGS
ncbi:unnamed protein product, partial [Rotaria magnacalcarata]